MHRMRRVLVAMKMAEMAQLGANRTAATAARAKARELRAQSRAQVADEVPGAMAALGSWQRHAEALARDADATAARLDLEAEPMMIELARTLGRETVVTGLIGKAEIEDRRIAARRAEGAPPRGR